LRIELGEPHERVVERDHVEGIERRAVGRLDSAVGAGGSGPAERDLDPSATALRRVPRAGVIDQDAAHHPRGDREELRAALPPPVALFAEAEPRLVHERGGLQRVALPLPPQHERRLPAELRVDEAYDRVARLDVARAPRAQQLRDRVARGGRLAGRGLLWCDVGWRMWHDGRSRARGHLGGADGASTYDTPTDDWVMPRFPRYGKRRTARLVPTRRHT
jgi:hypothetical protein